MSYRDDFPIFAGQPDLVYLDSAATAQKPWVVVEAVAEHYRTRNANVHRGAYGLSLASTAAYEQARATVAGFIGAQDPAEIVFTRGATEAINLLAATLTQGWQSGDEIILSDLEHHANLVPWQQASERGGLALRFVRSGPEGDIDLDHFSTLLSPRTRLASLSHCSNVTGRLNPLHLVKKRMCEQGSEALLIVDACQTAPHLPLLVAELEADFLVFSGHKVYGPSGIGVLWGRRPLLEQLPPYQTGGDMIRAVTRDGSTWNDTPWKFEAGTPNIEGAVGLGAAVSYLEAIGMTKVAEHTASLFSYALRSLQSLPGIRVVGNPTPEIGIISFTAEGIHAHDIADQLGQLTICIRAGHHCAAPLHDALGLAASARISLGIYSTTEDIDRFTAALGQLITDFANV